MLSLSIGNQNKQQALPQSYYSPNPALTQSEILTIQKEPHVFNRTYIVKDRPRQNHLLPG